METKTETKQAVVAKRKGGDFTDQLIEPFNRLRNEVDRLFDSFPLRLPTLPLPRIAIGGAPAIEMSETDSGYKVTAELAGIEPKDVEVTFDDGMLRIAGERKEEREQTERGYRLSERSYGAFERIISLPAAADPDKIEAKFKNGLLTVTVGKDGEKQNVRRIQVQA